MKTALRLSVGVALLISLAYASTNSENPSSAPAVLIEPKFLLPQLDLTSNLNPELTRETDQFDTFTIGRTWDDLQHLGTVGRMVARDSLGYLHFVWTNKLDQGGTNRHIYYNLINPAGVQGWPGYGTQVDAVYRAGYTVLDVGYGNRAFPCFHQVETQGSLTTWTAIAGDVQPHFGAFLINPAPPLAGVNQMLWPTMQLGRNGVFHLLAAADYTSGYHKYFYISATYNLSTFQLTYAPSWTYVDSIVTTSADIGASRISNKVAFAWIALSGDIYYLIDADGLNPDFTQAINLTNFTPQDTFLTHNDLSVFVDQNDYTHIAFTTKGYHAGPPPSSYVNASLIWHWSNQYPNDFRVIANAFDPADTVACGPGDLKAGKPSLGQSPTTGDLYCIYQYYDTRPEHLSAIRMPSGEVFVAVSTDDGINWSYPYNCTQTETQFGAPAGACMSEVAPSLAKWVTDYCHIMFVQDKDAGYVGQLTGAATLNPVKYLREPVSWIPTQPIIPQNIPLHVETPTYPIQVTLTPFGPIVIPPGGGSFNFNITLQNITSVPYRTDAWSFIKLPSGALFGPVLGPLQNLTLGGGQVLNRYRTQFIPGNAPAGSYQYIGYVGNYTSPTNYTVGDSTFFPFTKTGVDAGGMYQEWLSGGEAFADLASAWSHSRAPLQPEDLRVSVSPNPFNPTTVISFELRAASCVKFEVFDVKGQRVGTGLVPVQGGGRTPALQWYNAGPHQIKFDGSGLPSGVYLYQVQVGSQRSVGKMVLMK